MLSKIFPVYDTDECVVDIVVGLFAKYIHRYFVNFCERVLNGFNKTKQILAIRAKQTTSSRRRREP